MPWVWARAPVRRLRHRDVGGLQLHPQVPHRGLPVLFCSSQLRLEGADGPKLSAKLYLAQHCRAQRRWRSLQGSAHGSTLYAMPLDHNRFLGVPASLPWPFCQAGITLATSNASHHRATSAGVFGRAPTPARLQPIPTPSPHPQARHLLLQRGPAGGLRPLPLPAGLLHCQRRADLGGPAEAPRGNRSPSLAQRWRTQHL